MPDPTQVAQALHAYLNVLGADQGELGNFLSNRSVAVSKWFAANRLDVDADAIAEAEGVLITGNFKLAQRIFADAGSGKAPLSLWVTSWVTSQPDPGSK